MAYAQAAAYAANALVKYGPQVANRALELTSKVTGGRVRSAQDLAKFVKNDASSLSVVANAFAKAGIRPDDIIPADLVGSDQKLAAIRASVEQTAQQMRDQFDNGSDRILAATPADAARDVLRRRRVEAVLNVYGTEVTYYLCHPNGGVPREDFAWYKAMNFGSTRI